MGANLKKGSVQKYKANPIKKWQNFYYYCQESLRCLEWDEACTTLQGPKKNFCFTGGSEETHCFPRIRYNIKIKAWPPFPGRYTVFDQHEKGMVAQECPYKCFKVHANLQAHTHHTLTF